MKSLNDNNFPSQIIPNQRGGGSLEQAGKAPSNDRSNCGVTLEPREKQEIIHDCVIEVLKTLKRMNER